MSDSKIVTPRSEKGPELVKILKENTDRAFTQKELAGVLNCTKTMVCNYLKKLEDENHIVVLDKRGKHGAKLHKPTESIHEVDEYAAYPIKFYINNGYRVVHHHHRGERHSFPLHKLVAVAEYGIDEVKGKHIHHKNKHSIDNRPSNLIPLEKSEHKTVDSVLSALLGKSDENKQRIISLAMEGCDD